MRVFDYRRSSNLFFIFLFYSSRLVCFIVGVYFHCRLYSSSFHRRRRLARPCCVYAIGSPCSVCYFFSLNRVRRRYLRSRRFFLVVLSIVVAARLVALTPVLSRILVFCCTFPLSRVIRHYRLPRPPRSPPPQPA